MRLILPFAFGLGLVIAGCELEAPQPSSSGPTAEHCDLGDTLCNRDPARARTAAGSCHISWTADHPFQCRTALDDGVEFAIRWTIDHPTPAAGSAVDCEADWEAGRTYPMALISHGGGGQDFLDYQYLTQHLALNDFIAISLSTTPSPATNTTAPSQRASIMAAFLSCLRSDEPANFVGPFWNGELAAIGHSRGGEAAVRLAQSLAEEPESVDVVAVVALGPPLEEDTVAPENGDPLPCLEPAITGADTPALLVINGSHELDGGRGIAYYDRAEGEFDALPADLTKSLVWVPRGWHNGYLQDQLFFRDGPDLPVGPDALHPAVHRMLLKAYANAFLRWQVFGHDYKDFFTGAARSAAVQAVADEHDDGPVAIVTRYAEGQGARRRVVDNAECPTACGGPGEPACWEVPSIAPLPLVSSVGQSTGVTEVSLHTMFEPPNSSVYGNNRTRALLVRWDENMALPNAIVPAVGFRIPEGVDPVSGFADPDRTPGGPFADLRFFTHLVLDVGQLPDAVLADQLGGLQPVNGDPDDPATLRLLDFFVALHDSSSGSRRVRVSEIGDLLPAPSSGIPNPYQSEIAYPVGPDTMPFPRGHLQTLRVPLSAYCGVDLNRIAAISLDFDAMPLVSTDEGRFLRGAMVLDRLAFVTEAGARSALSACPICGNAVVDPGEECDDGNLVDDDGCSNICRLTAGVSPGSGGGGTQVGGSCLAVGLDHEGLPVGTAAAALLFQGSHPDGNESAGLYCMDDPALTDVGELVCSGAGPTCVACGGIDHPMASGCTCDPNVGQSCGPGNLTCWPTTLYAEGQSVSGGRCWPSATGIPNWECQADCTGPYGQTGYCFRGAVPTTAPICADHGCDLNGAACAEQGLACIGGQCVEECNATVSCQDRGYPSGYACNTMAGPGRCFIAGVPHP